MIVFAKQTTNPKKFRSEERRVGKEIIPICKIYTVEEEALGGGSKGGVEKKN